MNKLAVNRYSYKYGKDYEEAASNLPESEIPIICSDKSDYSTLCMYLKDGTKVSCN